MRKIVFLFLYLLAFQAIAQETNTRGTITVQKKAQLKAVLYDNVNFRLVCKDIYGNIHDSAVVSYNFQATIKGLATYEDIIGNTLSPQMQQRLSRLDSEIILRFYNIKAKEKNGDTVSFPEFKVKEGRNREQVDN